MNWETALGAVLTIAAFCCGLLMGKDIKQGEWDAAKASQAQAQQKALEEAAKAIAKINVTQQTIVQKVQHETETKTVYRDCIVPDSGLRLLQQAIENRDKPTGADGMQTPASAPGG